MEGVRLIMCYSGHYGQPLYRCVRRNQRLNRPSCLAFGAKRVDTAIGRELRHAVEPIAVEAALPCTPSKEP